MKLLAVFGWLLLGTAFGTIVGGSWVARQMQANYAMQQQMNARNLASLNACTASLRNARIEVENMQRAYASAIAAQPNREIILEAIAKALLR